MSQGECPKVSVCYGGRARAGMIEVALGATPFRMMPKTARELADRLRRSADIAEHDGRFVDFIIDRAGMPLEQARALLPLWKGFRDAPPEESHE